MRKRWSIIFTALSFVPAMAIEPEKFFENYCHSCHDEWEQKGDLRLDQLDTLPLEVRLDVFNKIQEQLYFEQMPPKKKKKQPGVSERKEMLVWVAGELKRRNASTLEDK